MPQPLADMCSNTCWLLIPCFHCHQGSLQWCFRHPSCRRPNTSSRSVESSKQWNLRFKNVPNAYHHIPRDTTNSRVTQQVLVSASAGGKRVAIAAARWLFLHNPAIMGSQTICQLGETNHQIPSPDKVGLSIVFSSSLVYFSGHGNDWSVSPPKRMIWSWKNCQVAKKGSCIHGKRSPSHQCSTRARKLGWLMKCKVNNNLSLEIFGNKIPIRDIWKEINHQSVT